MVVVDSADTQKHENNWLWAVAKHFQTTFDGG